jgi:hypothetical protein
LLAADGSEAQPLLLQSLERAGRLTLSIGCRELVMSRSSDEGLVESELI